MALLAGRIVHSQSDNRQKGQQLSASCGEMIHRKKTGLENLLNKIQSINPTFLRRQERHPAPGA